MPTVYMEKSEVENLDEQDIRKLIDDHVPDPRYQRLADYYEGKHDILSRVKKDSTLPNNKIVNNMAKYVTDTAVGYFIGNPIAYSSRNDAFCGQVQDIFVYNDEQDHNAELAKKCSIVGHCYEMLYIDEDANIRIARVSPQYVTLIAETGYKTPLAAIRTIDTYTRRKVPVRKVEFWNWREVWYFKSVNGGPLELTDVRVHYWNDVPFVEYINNEERMGDFEGIISIIDAYNKATSNTANLFEYNDEAILKVLGLGEVSAADVRDMKEKGAIILENGGDINWLLKEVNDTALENHKNRLYKNMHTFSNVPNMSDESFTNSPSGVAVSYKLWNLEQICAIKERKFKKGLQRRVELITNILRCYGNSYDYRDIEMQFRRNKPQNLLELAQIFTQLAGEVSHETRLKLLPIIEDVKNELKKLADEKKDELDNFGGQASIDTVLRELEALSKEGDAA